MMQDSNPESPTSASSSRVARAARWAAIFAASAILSFGLCGASIKLYPDDYVTFLGLFSLLGMLLGTGGFLLASVYTVILAIEARGEIDKK